jgi:nitrate reductase gamma subunit
VDDFDLATPGPSAAPAVPPLTDISIAFALLTYFAFAVLVLGLVIQTWRLLREIRRTPADPGSGSILGRLFRAGADVVLLRSVFFSDRWAWIFGAMFHFGLLLVLIRHLRYFIRPGWVGPLWDVIVLEQPFGFYGGMALPFGAACWWLRQTVLRKSRIVTDWADHAVMALLVAIPLVGYASTISHTDVVAVKAFAIGLVTFHWINIPTDPLLLTHLWLVAVLMVVLPFSRLLLLLPFGNLLHIESAPIASDAKRRSRLVYAFGPALILVLLAPLAIVGHHGIVHQDRPDFASLIADHRTDDPTMMIRNHPAFLFSHRTIVTHTGVGAPIDSMERCVTCHAVKNAAGQPVGFDDPSHFCRGCHNTAAVTIDCFECHQSKPAPGAQAALDSLPRSAIGTALKAERVAEQ